jgi:hypothetical protein
MATGIIVKNSRESASEMAPKEKERREALNLFLAR